MTRISDVIAVDITFGKAMKFKFTQAEIELKSRVVAVYSMELATGTDIDPACLDSSSALQLTSAPVPKA